MPVFGTTLVIGATPVPNGFSGSVLTCIGGVLQSSEKFIWDGASALTLQTLTDADTSDTVLTLGVHANEGDAAAFTATVAGGGTSTPDTTFTFPGAAIFSVPSTLTINGAATQQIVFDLTNPSFTAVSAEIFGFIGFGAQSQATSDQNFVLLYGISDLDADETSPALRLGVHLEESNAAQFQVGIDGASGNATPDTTFTFPGAALFTGASGYSFDNTIIPGSFAFASLPTAAAGMMATVTDSSTATWGATIAGGGANNVQARYNGANWTVVGK